MNLLHALFTRNLLMSGVAIVRYIPRAFQVKQVDGNLFFMEEKRQEYRRRVESVTPHSPRQWGPWRLTRRFTISTWRAEAPGCHFRYSDSLV